jgi:hypothetical protein
LKFDASTNLMPPPNHQFDALLAKSPTKQIIKKVDLKNAAAATVISG